MLKCKKYEPKKTSSEYHIENLQKKVKPNPLIEESDSDEEMNNWRDEMWRHIRPPKIVTTSEPVLYYEQ